MPLTWAEAVTADKVEVKESHIEELREGVDTVYDYAVDIDGRLGVLEGRVDQHVGSVGLSNHGAASTGAAGFMTPTMVSQLAQLAAYLNPDGTLNFGDGGTGTGTGTGTVGAAVISGLVYHGQQVPLPSGFTESQCKWIVSPAIHRVDDDDVLRCYTSAVPADNGANNSGGWQSDSLGNAGAAGRYVTCWTSQRGANYANYITIGIS